MFQPRQYVYVEAKMYRFSQYFDYDDTVHHWLVSLEKQTILRFSDIRFNSCNAETGPPGHIAKSVFIPIPRSREIISQSLVDPFLGHYINNSLVCQSLICQF